MDNDAPLDGNDDDFMEWLKKHKLQSYQQALEEEASSMIHLIISCCNDSSFMI
jgi:hypothetical protein